jgi:hypothetical protein
MLMAFPIPRDAIPGIVRVINLSEAIVDELVRALKNAPHIFDSDKMAKHISSSLPSIQADELVSILDILYRLYYVREFSGVPFTRFLDDFIDGMGESSHSDLDAKHVEFASLRVKLEKLLNIDSLKIISKASRLQSDGERLYCHSKILSDIRPVFGDDPTAKPSAAVITHTLKITYHMGQNNQEFHVVLDSHELAELRDVLNRASAKDETLRALMKEANLLDLGQ